MIDTDKMKAAWAATPLCQHKWTEKDEEGNGPTKLCAISSLVAFAGVQPDLIAKMDKAETYQTWAPSQISVTPVPRWVAILALPVLRAEYGIPENLATHFPSIFDKQENEWRGVEEVLALCEKHNMDEMHLDALREDISRFPQQMTAAEVLWGTSPYAQPCGIDWGTTTLKVMNTFETVTTKQMKPKGQTETGKSKYWTAPPKNYNPPPKLLTTV